MIMFDKYSNGDFEDLEFGRADIKDLTTSPTEYNAGSYVFAVGDGFSGKWESFMFKNESDVYDLKKLHQLE